MDDGTIGTMIGRREYMDIRQRVKALEDKNNAMVKIMLSLVDVLPVLLGDKIIPKEIYDKWILIFKKEGLL